MTQTDPNQALSPFTNPSSSQILGQTLTVETLVQQNRDYAGSAGISQGNRGTGFRPAFYNHSNGDIALSRFANGSLAPIHLLDGLPQAWVLECSDHGHVSAIKPDVVAGFERDGSFYTRSQVAQFMANEQACL